MKKFSNVLAVVVILVAICTTIFSCSEMRSQRSVITTDIVMIEPYGNSQYTVALHGYTITSWSKDYVVVKVDPSITKGKPKATFTMWKGKPYSWEQVILSFHNIEEAKKALKGGIEFDLDVEAGRDASIAISKSESSSCFINSVRGIK